MDRRNIDKRSLARRQAASIQLTQIYKTPSAPREFPAAPFSAAIKRDDPETRRLIDEALRERANVKD